MSGMTESSSNQTFLQTTLNLTLEFLSDIISDINAIGEFTPEKEYFWNNKVISLAGDVSKFVELSSLLTKSILMKKKVSLDHIKQSHIHLLFILKGMNQARLKNDHAALDDLIKYELKDNLTQWKIDLIPQAKKILNS